MRTELDEKLCEKYPKIFANRYADMKTTAMCWGFECGDGWYNIINMLCANIQHHIDWSQKQHDDAVKYNDMITAAQAGDLNLIDEYFDGWKNSDEAITRAIEQGLRKVEIPVPQVTAAQVKEKFGTLRFYYSGGDDEISGMVRMAEAMSSVTCEECGTPGKQRGGGWVRTLCDQHAEEKGYYSDDEV
jgi:hypothetical protein